MRAPLRLATTLAAGLTLGSSSAGSISLKFDPPVLLGGHPWHSAAAKTDLSANESFVDTFFVRTKQPSPQHAHLPGFLTEEIAGG